jgi:hypothetical protein
MKQLRATAACFVVTNFVVANLVVVIFVAAYAYTYATASMCAHGGRQAASHALVQLLVQPRNRLAVGLQERAAVSQPTVGLFQFVLKPRALLHLPLAVQLDLVRLLLSGTRSTACLLQRDFLLLDALRLGFTLVLESARFIGQPLDCLHAVRGQK